MKKFIISLILFVSSLGFTNAQWQQTSIPSGTGQLGYQYLVANGTDIYLGATSGLFKSDNGAGWNMLNDNVFGPIAISGSNIFAATSINSGISLSTDDGASWTAANNGLPSNLPISSITISGSNIFIGAGGTSGGVYLSSNNGSSWVAVNNGLPYHIEVTSIEISGSNIFAGTLEGIFLSNNNGGSWTAVNTNLTNTNIDALAVSGSNIFAGTYGDGVFLSDNNGTSWTPVNSGLTSLEIISIKTIGNNIFAKTTDGIFLSINNGANWTSVSTGLPVQTILDFPYGDHELTISNYNLYTIIDTSEIWERPLFQMIDTIPDTITADAGPDVTICGCDENYVTLTATGGTYYHWSTGDSTASIIVHPLITTTYTVTVSDGSNYASDDVTVFVTPPLEGDMTVTPETDGLCNGSATITISNGTPPYLYYWSNSSTDQTISDLCSGIYSVTVTDGTGCNCTFDCIVMTDSLTAYAGPDVTICGCDEEYVPLTATGGTFYHWSTGDTTASIIVHPLTTTTYTVTVSDGSNYASDDVTVFVTPPLEGDITITPATGGLCNGSATITISNGTPPFLYYWSNSSTNATITDLCPGIYSVTVSDGTGCNCTFDCTILDDSLCNASFIFHQDSLNTLTYHFINTSTGVDPLNTYYYWQFGDYTSSTDINPTHTYQNPGFYNVCLYILDSLNNLNCSYCDTIAIDTTSGCNSYFTYYLQNDGHTYQFVNMSHFDSGSNFYYSWDFGDGSHSFDTNPTHIFSDTGTFNVCLIVFTGNGTDTCDDIYCTDILVGDGNYPDSLKYTIQGAVHADDNMVTSAAVILFNADYGYYNAVDYKIVSDGTFQFDNVTPAHYILWAIPDISIYQDYLPTYYGDVLYWQDAYAVNVIANTYGLDIHLLNIDSLFGGKLTDDNGSIGGTVLFENEITYETGIFSQDWFGGKSGDGIKNNIAGRNIPIYLKDTNGDVISWALADINGDFDLSNLPLQDYTVNAEKPSLQSVSPVISLTSAYPDINNVIITIGAHNIVTSVDDQLSYEILNSLSFYPNPVKDDLTIDFTLVKQANIDVSVLNITGQEIKKYNYSLSEGANKIAMDLNELNSGIYFVRINVDNVNSVNFKFVK